MAVEVRLADLNDCCALDRRLPQEVQQVIRLAILAGGSGLRQIRRSLRHPGGPCQQADAEQPQDLEEMSNHSGGRVEGWRMGAPSGSGG